MEILRIIAAIEEAVYQSAIWILLLPKTFYRVMRNPSWIAGYVRNEFLKKPDERFDEYMSPLFFWLLVCVLPFYFVLTSNINNNYDINETSWAGFNILKRLASMEVRIIYTTAILAAWPLAFSAILQIFRGETINRSALAPGFYIQCLCVSPPAILLMPLFLLLVFLSRINLATTLSVTITGLIGIIWFSWAEYKIIRSELGFAPQKSIVLFFGACIASLILSIIIGIVLVVYFADLPIWLFFSQ